MNALRSICLVWLLTLAAPALAEGEGPPKGWLGVGIAPATAEQQQALSVTRPVPCVTRLFRGSPAEGGGVQVGDFILTLDDHALESVKDLVSRVGAIKPGTEIRLTIARGASAEPRLLRIALDLKPNLRLLLRQEQTGRSFPNLKLEDAEGQAFEVGAPDSRGRVWVIDWFTTWCGPCKRLAPHLAKLQETHVEAGLRVVGVTGEDREVFRPWAANHGKGYSLMRDPDRAFRRVLMASVLPTVWVVDRAGIVVDVIFGSGDVARIDRAVAKAMKGPRLDDDGNVRIPQSPAD